MQPNTDYSRYFKKCFKRIELESRRTNELAYLAFTGKIEDTIRDKLAYCLQFQFQSVLKNDNIRIGRELKRRDIVILEKYTPDKGSNFKANAVIELSATHLQTLRKDPEVKRYLGKIRNDIAKAKKFMNTNQVYAILLATEFASPVKDTYKIISKYYKSPVCPEPSTNIIKKIKGLLKAEHGQVFGKRINIGKIFETELSLYYWIIGPIWK